MQEVKDTLQEHVRRAKTMLDIVSATPAIVEDSFPEYCSEEEVDYIEEDDPVFSEESIEEIEEDSSEDDFPKEKKARRRDSILKGKKICWSRHLPERLNDPKNPSSKSEFIPQGKGAAENVPSPINAWSLQFSDEILNIILKYTNQEIERKRNSNSYQIDQTDQNTLDMLELKAFIGLLYYAGWGKENNTSAQCLWSAHSLPLFRATMTKDRFLFILSSLMFDDKTTRNKRIESDRFAQVREIWDLFIRNCIRYYEPGFNVTIDEQLLDFEGKCNFRVHLRKSDQYGLKIMTMFDSQTYYLINAIPHIGNVETESSESISSYYVKKLSEPIHKTNRNITCDSWFTSVPLVDDMRNKFSLTMVGGLRKNDPEIPPSFKATPPKGTCQFAYYDNKTLVSYKSTKNKIVLLLSSLYLYGEMKEDTPEVVNHYNEKCKDSIDIFDKAWRLYSVARKTKRWSVRIFYGILDQALVNSYVLYTLNIRQPMKERDLYSQDLSMALIKPYLIQRLSNASVNFSIKSLIEPFLEKQDLPKDSYTEPLDNKLNKQEKCKHCSPKSMKTTTIMCVRCKKPMCKDHVAKICQYCAEN